MLKSLKLSLLVLLISAPALADGLAVPADVISVYDGDTFKANAHPWPGMTMNVSIRVNGVDTPEIRGKCQAEKDTAIAARDYVREVLGESVILKNVKRGKYAGRVVADVYLEDGRNLTELLIAAGLGRAYDGGKRSGWCD
ncbi:thermonuclease family protein [Kiloniella antarctica]|uniref:Thermonuclease family protein n=1 Tax=Kiloniella antarctica TaxID=1550907 RepID=A0ABW5BKK4_9PROT